jgi:hypothetical protein
MLAHRIPSTLTLAEAVHQIQESDAAKEAGADGAAALSIVVEPELGGKPVELFGGSYSSTDSLVRSLATLYGLELLVPKERHYSLVMPIPRMPQTREAFPTEIKRLIPMPLLDQYRGLSETFATSVLAQQQTGLIDPALSLQALDMQKRVQGEISRREGAKKAAIAGYYPAVRRLLVLTKPLVPTSDSKPVAFNQANPEVLRLVAIMLYSVSCRTAINDMVSMPLPVCLFDPSRLIIKTEERSSDSRTTLYFMYGYKDENGTFHNEGQCSESAQPGVTQP